MPKARNVLLITSDQHRGDCYGFEGRKVRTPHLDELAGVGTRFSSCITPNVVCQPSRASILTGLLPSGHGVVDNGYDLPDEAAREGFAQRFSGSGYATGFFGKAHFSTRKTFKPTGSPECRFSQENFGPEWFGPYKGFGHVELCVEGHYWEPVQKPPKGQHYERWLHSAGQGNRRNQQQFSRLSPDSGCSEAWNSALPPAWHSSTWVADRTIEFLRRQKNEPFCIWSSFPDPHEPFDCPAPWCYLHHSDEIDLPNNRSLDIDRRPWWHEAALNPPDASYSPGGAELDTGDSSNTGYSRLAPSSEKTLRHIVANYYGMISLIDHNVGRILIALRENGLDENTIVIFTSDHGEWLGDHGLLYKGPMTYDGLMRVGFIMRGPDIAAGNVNHDPMSTLDIGATIYDYCDVSGPLVQHGQSLRPLVDGTGSRDFAYHEWDLDPTRYGIEQGLKLRTARTRTHKLTVDLQSGAGELYDLVNDPMEMTNLFKYPSTQKIKIELQRMIQSRRQEPSDVSLERVGTN